MQVYVRMYMSDKKIVFQVSGYSIPLSHRHIQCRLARGHIAMFNEQIFSQGNVYV